MSGEQLYELWAAVWADMDTGVEPWDSLDDDERNAWATLAEQLTTT